MSITNDEVIVMVDKLLDDQYVDKLTQWEWDFINDMSEETEFTENQGEKVWEIHERVTK